MPPVHLLTRICVLVSPQQHSAPREVQAGAFDAVRAGAYGTTCP